MQTLLLLNHTQVPQLVGVSIVAFRKCVEAVAENANHLNWKGERWNFIALENPRSTIMIARDNF